MTLVEPDAAVDVDAANGTYAVPGIVTCDLVATSEVPTTTPDGPGLLTTISSYTHINMDGVTQLRTCDDVERCDVTIPPMGQRRVQCSTTTTYTVIGIERWTQEKQWTTEVLP